MKTQKITAQTSPKVKLTRKNLASKITKPLENLRNIELPSLDSLGRSLVFFNKQKAGERTEKILKEIEATKNEIKLLENYRDGAEPSEVSNARSDIKFYEDWDKNRNTYYNEAVKKANKAKEETRKREGGFSCFFTNKDGKAYDKAMTEHYNNSNNRYWSLSSKIDDLRSIVSQYDNAKASGAASRRATLAALRGKLKSLEESVDFVDLAEKVNASLSNKGSVEQRIAGYGDVKSQIQTFFIEPLLSKSSEVPSAIMLYGATGCGKTTFLNGIASQCKDVAEVYNFSGSETTGSFLRRIEIALDAAKKLYIDSGKRTILLMNEAESFLAMHPTDLKKSAMGLDPDDISKIERYNKLNGGSCSKNVNRMKDLLDHISKTPEEGGFATTIFITSNYPHLIHPDLLSRDGVDGKLMHVAVKPAKDSDLKAVMQHYFQKFSDLIEQLKYFGTKPNAEELVYTIAGISKMGKETLIKKMKNGTIENMSIDPTLGHFPNLEAFIRGNNPSLAKGAYSNARLQNAARMAFLDYLENPTVSYEEYFCKRKNEMGRDILPDRYRHFMNIYDMVQNPEAYNAKESSITDDVKDLIKKYNDGLLSKEDLKNAKLKIQDIKKNYDILKEKSNLSTAEKNAIETYEEFFNALDEAEFEY